MYTRITYLKPIESWIQATNATLVNELMTSTGDLKLSRFRGLLFNLRSALLLLSM